MSVIITKHVFLRLLDNKPQAELYRFRVTAINTGQSGTVLANAGISSADTGESLNVEDYREYQGDDIAGPTFPVELPAHGSISWDFQDPSVSNFAPGDRLVGFVSRYRPVRLRKLLRRKLETQKLYKSPYTETKGDFLKQHPPAPRTDA